MPITHDPAVALERLERAIALWTYLLARWESYVQQGQLPPLQVETRLWRVAAYTSLLASQLTQSGLPIVLPFKFLAFVSTGIHSALLGDPPRPFFELRYLGSGTNPSPRDILDQETAAAFVELAASGKLAVTEEEAIAEAASAYGKAPVTIRRWHEKRSAAPNFLTECGHEVTSGYAGDLTEAARNLIRQTGARYRVRASRATEERFRKSRKKKAK